MCSQSNVNVQLINVNVQLGADFLVTPPHPFYTPLPTPTELLHQFQQVEGHGESAGQQQHHVPADRRPLPLQGRPHALYWPGAAGRPAHQLSQTK